MNQGTSPRGRRQGLPKPRALVANRARFAEKIGCRIPEVKTLRQAGQALRNLRNLRHTLCCNSGLRGLMPSMSKATATPQRSYSQSLGTSLGELGLLGLASCFTLVPCRRRRRQWGMRPGCLWRRYRKPPSERGPCRTGRRPHGHRRASQKRRLGRLGRLGSTVSPCRASFALLVTEAPGDPPAAAPQRRAAAFRNRFTQERLPQDRLAQARDSRRAEECWS